MISTWTIEKPTRGGRWWHRAQGEVDYPEVVSLVPVNQGKNFWVHYCGLAEGDYLSDMCDTDEWSSLPIEPPQEAP